MRITRIPKKNGGGIFVELDHWDALRLAESLMAQVRTNNPNANRAEFRIGPKREYFTVAAMPKRDR